MLLAVFYARFHSDRGPSPIHQYPNGCIKSPPDSQTKAFVNWSDISSYVIPSYDLCNRPLSICSNGHRVMGLPVSLENEAYDRNRFTFNVCFVLPEDSDEQPWRQIVKKTAAFFTSLELEDGMLQREEHLKGLKWAGENDYPTENVGVVYGLLQSIVEDINTFGETCIRMDAMHVLNLRVSRPAKTPAPKVKAWEVPLLIRSLPLDEEWTHDITLEKLSRFIDGVNHVQRIAELADVEVRLAKKTIRNLLFHEQILILDKFHFQAIYVLTRDFDHFVKDKPMLAECREYVSRESGMTSLVDSSHNVKTVGGFAALSSPETIISLYRSFSTGLSVYDLAISHPLWLSGIDVRRFITYGVIKGFLRRVHRYALAVDNSKSGSQLNLSSLNSLGKSNEDATKELDRAWKKAALSSGWETPPNVPMMTNLDGTQDNSLDQSTEAAGSHDQDRLWKYLDGRHCLDQVCVELHKSEKSVLKILESGRFGEVIVFSG